MVRAVFLSLILLTPALRLSAQFVLPEQGFAGSLSLHPAAEIAHDIPGGSTFGQVWENPSRLSFESLEGPNTNLGFTNGAWWVRFALKNTSPQPVNAYLETGRPITDEVTLFLTDEAGNTRTLTSGDKGPFRQRVFNHRKSVFPITLEPGQTLQAHLFLRSDGEVINLPLMLRDAEDMIITSYVEQLVYGFFYGILLLAAVMYFFFYFALKERSFLLYSLYVVFVGGMQFALDGLFYQYAASAGGWINDRAVLLFAVLSTAFFALYNKEFLKVNVHSQGLNTAYKVALLLLSLLLLCVAAFPELPAWGYPAANALGMGVLVLSVAALGVRIARREPADGFFTTGILFLVAGYIVFILNNFSLIPNSFLSENAAKLGTGLEVIFLSLSMANRIRILKSEKEEMQSLALTRSEEMNEIKSYFLSNMSHELRTPLNAIMALSDLMVQEGSDPKVRANCEVIRSASVGLLTSVNDILDFSKIEKGELTLDKAPFSLTKTLEPIWQVAGSQGRQKGLECVFTSGPDLPALVMGDAMRLGQIVQNLLNNAVKFTPEGFVRLDMQAKTIRENKVQVTLTIEDSGIGIPAQKIESLFASFSQANITHKRKFGGLGLGLSIVKHLVDLHGGQIRIQSSEGAGTTCIVLLTYELAPAPKPAAPIYPTDTFDLLGTHILMVEDNPVNQLVLKAVLKKWANTTVAVANDGQEALDYLAGQPADLILMDLQMPVMDGYEATEAIRGGLVGDAIKDIPIIAVTADVAESTKKRVLELGMDAYLTKPVDKELLYQTVTEVLTRKKKMARV